MSAWIVNKAHVDMLVQVAIMEGLVKAEDATTTGRMLWLENHRSIEARYGDPVPEAKIAEYLFEGIEAPLDDRIVHLNVGCYRYQTCEHEGWLDSEAHRLCEALEVALEVRLGPDPNTGHTPWGISSLDQAVAR